MPPVSALNFLDPHNASIEDLPASLHLIKNTPTEDFYNSVSNLEFIELQVIASLPNLSEDEVTQTRLNAGKLGLHQWRIEIACDAEIWNRAEAKRGRGNKDVDGVGIMAAVKRRAEQVGCTSNTIILNAKIHNLFKDKFNHTISILPEKSFYRSAIVSDFAADYLIDEFVKQKQADASFSPTDAWKFVVSLRNSKQNRPQLASTNATVDPHETIEEHIAHAMQVVRGLIDKCPSQRLVDSLYEPLIYELEEYLEDIDSNDAEDKLRRAWENGYRREDQMAIKTGLSKSDVAAGMQRLAGTGEFIQVDQRGETEMARGSYIKLWHKVGEPIAT